MKASARRESLSELTETEVNLILMSTRSHMHTLSSLILKQFKQNTLERYLDCDMYKS